MNLLVKDERRLQLLESRLGNTPLASNIRTTQDDAVNANKKSPASAFSQGDDIARLSYDNKTKTSVASAEKAAIPGPAVQGDRNDVQQNKVINEDSATGSKRASVENDVSTEMDASNASRASNDIILISDNSSHQQKQKKPKGEFDHASPTAQQNDNGSRGAGGTKRTIQSYFSIQPTSGDPHQSKSGDHNSLFQSSTASSSTSNTTANVTMTSHPAISSATAPPSSSSSSSYNHSMTGQKDSAADTDRDKDKDRKTNKASKAEASINLKEQNKQLANLVDIKKQLEQTKIQKDQAENKILRIESENRNFQERFRISEERNSKLTKSLENVYRKMAQQEFRRKRDRLALNCVRLGKIATMRTGPTTMGDVWEEGYGLKELNKRSAELLGRKEELEMRKKKTQTLKRAAKKEVEGSLDHDNDIDLDLVAEIDAIRCHLEQYKKDESALYDERRLLESEKAVHQKELKRCQCEERSRFYRDLPNLNDRYLLQSMLGRGGFSEVWKALDLVEIKEVAVKIHQLNPVWSEERKQSYIKHVTREYTIHRDMQHPRVVQLFDVFEIDINSFATVLEYCNGIDLDEKLKRQRTLVEKDARTIFMQIMSGLRYLNKPWDNGSDKGDGDSVDGDDGGLQERGGLRGGKVSIIHFDLKPANILFDEMGDVKITDFGLSKIIDESNEGTSMELTSQGAGTYWYLPPECFPKGGVAPRISSKVDVWSMGIIFYQMLYGCRPYGEGKSQESVWSEGLSYDQVTFPAESSKSPKVSEECKELIRACLTKDQRLRPDVLTLCQNPYLKNK